MATSLRDLLNTDITGRLNRYPELRLFEGAARQDAALATAIRALRGRHPWLAFKPFAYVVVYALVVVVPKFYATTSGHFADLWPLSMLACLIAVLLVEYGLHRWALPQIRAEILDLAWRRSTACAACEYSLIGNTSGRCPECGAEIPDDQRKLI
ncbi:MAG: hypothetical protein KDA71_13865, partial [Planctomycetales bacterium]|nr:hypothetical protein [Planctomycetales bacterium]